MATMEADPLNCTALIRYDNELCERHNSVESTAVHECIHLLLADLKHAFESNPEAAQMEEERIVTRLEPLIYRHLFKAE